MKHCPGSIATSVNTNTAGWLLGVLEVWIETCGQLSIPEEPGWLLPQCFRATQRQGEAFEALDGQDFVDATERVLGCWGTGVLASIGQQ